MPKCDIEAVAQVKVVKGGGWVISMINNAERKGSWGMPSSRKDFLKFHQKISIFLFSRTGLRQMLAYFFHEVKNLYFRPKQ